MAQEQAKFIKRNQCINCHSNDLKELDGGLFGDDPIRDYIEGNPWGENPMPYIEKQEWSLVQCNQCTQMFHRAILSPEWNEVRFTRWMTLQAIQEFEAARKSSTRDFDKAKQHVTHILRIENMTRGLRGPQAVRILDFGCGWGQFLAMCHQFGFTGYGVDRSSARREGGHGMAILPDLQELTMEPGTANSFHSITLFEVLEHLEDPMSVLRSLHPLLARGGLLVLETPNCSGLKGLRDRESFELADGLDHINAFTPRTLRSIAQRAGFTPIKPGIGHVTSDRIKVCKVEARNLLHSLLPARTQLYFRKA